MRRIRWSVTLALLIISTLLLLRIAVSWVAEADSVGSSLAQALAFLLPIGLALVAWSALPPDRSEAAAGLITLALAVALVGYLAIGFGLHFGGAAFVSDNPELQSLSRFFSLVRGDRSAGWGIFGLEGFFLSGDAATPAALRLFVSQLPLVFSIALIVMLALPSQTPPLAHILVGLIASAVTFPVAGHWVSGGGWLARLGDTLTLGHGLVDFSGTGVVLVVGGATVLAAALAFGRRPPEQAESASHQNATLPRARFPVLAALGALLAAVGWIALGLANPLHAARGAALDWSLTALNGLAGLAGGTLLAQLYSWFTIGRFDPLMGPRGALAGLLAVGAGAAFMPTWAALATGTAAGLLLPLAIYAVDHLLHFDDATAAIAGYALPGFWGLLAVAIFADGRWGQGWNGISGPPQAGSGQLAAQVWGGVSLFALGFLLPWGVFKLLTGLPSPRLPGARRAPGSDLAVASTLDPSSESQSAAGSLGRVLNIDDGG